MKRWLYHFLFWVVYFAFLVLTEFAWVSFYSKNQNNITILVQAIKACSVTIIPQIIFTYYISYVVLAKFISGRRKASFYVFEILALFFLTVFITQVLSHRIVGRYVYGILEISFQYQINQFLSFIIYIGFVCGVMVTVKFIKHQIKANDREKALIREKLSTELKMLRSQLNPHFLFNTLNNIYALARKQSLQTPDAVMKLSELLNFMLYESGKESISLRNEISFIQDYITLEQMRYNERLSIEFKMDIDDYERRLAPLLLLPLIENAFKHGASQLRFNSFIELNLSVKKDILLFSIKNNFEPLENRKETTNIGLSNTRRQLELLYREQSLSVFSIENIFHVELRINLNSYGAL